MTFSEGRWLRRGHKVYISFPKWIIQDNAYNTQDNIQHKRPAQQQDADVIVSQGTCIKIIHLRREQLLLKW